MKSTSLGEVLHALGEKLDGCASRGDPSSIAAFVVDVRAMLDRINVAETEHVEIALVDAAFEFERAQALIRRSLDELGRVARDGVEKLRPHISEAQREELALIARLVTVPPSGRDSLRTIAAARQERAARKRSAGVTPA